MVLLARRIDNVAAVIPRRIIQPTAGTFAQAASCARSLPFTLVAAEQRNGLLAGGLDAGSNPYALANCTSQHTTTPPGLIADIE